MTAPNTTPIFVKTPFCGVATCQNDVIGRGGTSILPGDETLIVTAGTGGGLLEDITAIPLGDNPEGTVRIFIKHANSPHLVICLPELYVPEILLANAGNTVALQSFKLELPEVVIGDVGTRGLRIPAGASIYAALSRTMTNGYNIIGTGGLYT